MISRTFFATALTLAALTACGPTERQPTPYEIEGERLQTVGEQTVGTLSPSEIDALNSL